MTKIFLYVILLISGLNSIAIGKYKDHLIIKGSIPDFRLLNDSVSIVFPMKNKLYKCNINSKTISDTLEFRLNGSISCLDYCPLTGLIAIGSQKGEMVLTDLEGHYQLLNNVQDQIISIKFSNDGNSLAVSTADNFLQLWHTRTHQLLWKSKGHEDHILSICFSPNDSVIYSGSADKRIAIWDKGKGVVFGYLNNINSWVRKVAISREDKMLYASTDQGFVYNWSISDRLPIFINKKRASGSWILSLLSNKNFIATGDQYGKVLVSTKFGDYRVKFNNSVINLEFISVHDQIILFILILNKGIYEIGISDNQVKFNPR